MPPFATRAERFLENRGEAARLVARRRIVVHLAFFARRVVLPPLDPRRRALADFARHGAARQQMLGAVDFGRLRKDRRAAVAHEQIDGGAERGLAVIPE